jgi:peptidoglycan/xylan/chitin deacetylase (PgdA/CDA1 family)
MGKGVVLGGHRTMRSKLVLFATVTTLALLGAACGTGEPGRPVISSSFLALSTSEQPPTTTTPPPAPPPYRGKIIGSTEHRTGGRHIALTFDDGPDPTWTPQVLHLLAQYHATATFCLIGVNVRARPELVRDIAAGGNALCDHTMHHDENLPSRTAAVIRSEIDEDRQAILAAAPGASIRYFRAPAGNFSKPGAHVSIQAIAASMGMQPLAWSIDTRDWTEPGTQAIVHAVQRADRHDVILMHDGGGNRAQTLAALRVLLPWLIAHGYHFDVPA